MAYICHEGVATAAREARSNHERKGFFQRVDRAGLGKAPSPGDPGELGAVAQDVGHELSDERLGYVAGGAGFDCSTTAPE